MRDYHDKDFDPTLHLIPLDKDKSPIILTGNKDIDNTLVAITDNGRISYFALDVEAVYLDDESIGRTFPLVNEIAKRLEERFPNKKDDQGNAIQQYLAVGVMYGREGEEAKFIYDVLGRSEYSRNLDTIYSALNSLHGKTVGEDEYIKIQEFLQSEAVSNWINNLISSLKEQLDWSNYVRRALDNE